MKIHTEQNLRDFEFWSGAKQTAELLTDEELDTIESMLEDIYPDGMSETQVNDIFWFEDEFIAECLGYEDFETLYNERYEDRKVWKA